MDPDINREEILKSRDNLLDTLIARIKSWDGLSESAMGIIEENDGDIKDLKSLMASLDAEIFEDRVYGEKIEFILEEQKKMILILSKRQVEVKDMIGQLSKKDVIKDNYIKLNKDSIFVDKDF